ncbi:MAG: hypothetical protein QM753_11515 [Thermomicrobiales bacterium]
MLLEQALQQLVGPGRRLNLAGKHLLAFLQGRILKTAHRCPDHGHPDQARPDQERHLYRQTQHVLPSGFADTRRHALPVRESNKCHIAGQRGYVLAAAAAATSPVQWIYVNRREIWSKKEYFF